jgi:adenine-specific DNA-methyltransferase
LTPAERILWRHLRGRRFDGLKFRRQHPVGPFYADFACHECRLVVELDGESHLDDDYRDDRRTAWLDEHGWVVLRFWNTQVFDELDAVLDFVYRICQERIASLAAPNGEARPLTPTPRPRSGGAGLSIPRTP